jgi:hypothetical protein
MDSDFRRIDREAAAQLSENDEDEDDTLVDPRPRPAHNSKVWVVFRGRTPGIYDNK